MQYLPHIIRDVVNKVSAEMQQRKSDRFEVFFEYGLFQDVFKTVYQKKDNHRQTYPLVWLVMPFDEDEGTKPHIQADVSCDIIIAMTTDVNWSMEERESHNFFPRIFPIYESLLTQITKDTRIQSQGVEMIRRKKRILPYWGGDESGNNNTPNLSKHYVDALQIKGLQLAIRNKKC